MEIPAWMYFSVWTLIGVLSFIRGIAALEKTTDLRSSISPVALFFFNHALAVAICHSSTHALLFRIKLKIHVQEYCKWLLFAIFPLVFIPITGDSFSWLFAVYSPINIFVLLFYFLPWIKHFSGEDSVDKHSILVALFPLFYFRSNGDPMVWYFPTVATNLIIVSKHHFAAVHGEQYGLYSHALAVLALFAPGGEYMPYSPPLVLVLAYFVSVARAAISGDERFQAWLPAIPENRILLKMKEVVVSEGKVIKFSAGMAATVVFQNCFRLTTFDHVVAFLYLAVAWVAAIAMVMSSHDLGIFNFLLSNVIVGCTVSQFGVGGTTWLAYGVSVFLYILRQKLDALCLEYGAEDEPAIIVWQD